MILPVIAERAASFLSTPSVRRATEGGYVGSDMYKFLSTPSVRRATGSRPDHRHPAAISIHALREEGDLVPWD